MSAGTDGVPVRISRPICEASSFRALFQLALDEQSAQFVVPPLPKRTAIGDPSLDQREAFGFDPADSHASRLSCSRETALFQDLEMLNDGRE